MRHTEPSRSVVLVPVPSKSLLMVYGSIRTVHVHKTLIPAGAIG